MRRVKSLESRVKSRTIACLGETRLRAGVTLVELLVTMLIITILAGLVLGVASVAGETAREAHTRHVVQRLDTLMTEYANSFRTRRVKVRDEVINAINNQSGRTAAEKGQLLAQARLFALRELMMMEMPDRWSDILLNDTLTGTPLYPIYLEVPPTATGTVGRTQVCANYLRQLNLHLQRANNPQARAALLANQGAECLYLIVSVAAGDGEGRAQFAEKNIGDTDGDGALEFLDGWGQPITLLRWAPGFNSQIQINANRPGGDKQDTSIAIAASQDHDPYDVYRVESVAFRLVPLIAAPGGDESLGLRVLDEYVAWKGIANPNAPFNGISNSGLSPKLSPYVRVADARDVDDYLGASLHFSDPANYDETSTDNIHNHLQGLR